MTKTKVLLSIDDEDLKKIDGLADAAGMSRSAYLVAMGKQGTATLYSAIDHLKTELTRYLENPTEREQERARSRRSGELVPIVTRMVSGVTGTMDDFKKGINIIVDAAGSPEIPTSSRGRFLEGLAFMRTGVERIMAMAATESAAMRMVLAKK